MKKNELRKLALLGLSAGVLLGTQVQADESNPIDLQYVLAKPSCKAHGGCGGLTASRDINNGDKEEAEEAEAEDADAAKAKKAAPKTNAKAVKKNV